ncbi:hypothetical protein BVX94_00295 [bacterium B17]|nr:hypothetical protein BVX94_00295 [bacterium B17]
MGNNLKRTILLIDDDPSLLLTLSDFLSFEGYEIVTASSGEEGLERLNTLDPDLIILDMSMPGMGGVGFLKQISTATGKPSHPVLVLTARANMAEFFSDMDVDGFIAKPCDPADLLMEVGRIVFLRSGETQDGEEEQEVRSVLVAEDDAGSNKRLVRAFIDAGFRIDGVLNGPEVLEKAIVMKPDVIVAKLVLRGMNGDAIATVLSEMPNTRNIPIVLYDDSDAQVPASKFLESGTGIKSFVRSNSPNEILAAVQSVL